MEYNKHQFKEINNHKILHKIGKHWVIVSASLLMALGIGTVSSHNAHAAVLPSVSNNSSRQATQNSSSNTALITESGKPVNSSAASVGTSNVSLGIDHHINSVTTVSSLSTNSVINNAKASLSNTSSTNYLSRSSSTDNSNTATSNSSTNTSSKNNTSLTVSSVMGTLNTEVKNNAVNNRAFNDLLNNIHTNKLPNLNGSDPSDFESPLDNIKNDLGILNKTLKNPAIGSFYNTLDTYVPLLGFAGLIGINRINFGTIKSKLLPLLVHGQQPIQLYGGYLDSAQAIYNSNQGRRTYNSILNNISTLTHENNDNQKLTLNKIGQELGVLKSIPEVTKPFSKLLTTVQDNVKEYLHINYPQRKDYSSHIKSYVTSLNKDRVAVADYENGDRRYHNTSVNNEFSSILKAIDRDYNRVNHDITINTASADSDASNAMTNADVAASFARNTDAAIEASASANASASSNSSANNSARTSERNVDYMDSFSTSYNASVISSYGQKANANVSAMTAITHDKETIQSAADVINDALTNLNTNTTSSANSASAVMSSAASHAYSVAYSAQYSESTAANYSKIYNDEYSVNYDYNLVSNLVNDTTNKNDRGAILQDIYTINNLRPMIQFGFTKATPYSVIRADQILNRVNQIVASAYHSYYHSATTAS